jgi:regulator of cell morphogenesis and NO signaling
MNETDEFSAFDRPTSTLIEHIFLRYHETHRRELPDLIVLAHEVETFHANDPNAPHGLTQALQIFLAEFNAHMSEEESVILATFDYMHSTKGVTPIAWFRDDHLRHEAAMNKIAAITHGFKLPSYSCVAWTRLYSGLRKLVYDLEEHFFIENNILFPRLEAKL